MPASLPQRLFEITQRLLPGADHDRVYSERPKPLRRAYMQAGIVNALIGDSRKHLHTAASQGRAVNPAGRLAESFARFTCLSLQHHDRARAFSDVAVLRKNATARTKRRINSPLSHEQIWIE